MPDDDLNVNDGGALRKQLEDTLAALKKAQSDNDALQTQLRSTSVRDLIAEMKVDPRAVKFYRGEPTKEALTEWLKDEGDIFAPVAEVPGSEQSGGTVVPDGQTPVPGFVQQSNPLLPQLPPGVTAEQLAAAMAASGMQPNMPSVPLGSVTDLTDKLAGLNFSGADDAKVLTDAWTAIRQDAAARLAAGGSL